MGIQPKELELWLRNSSSKRGFKNPVLMATELKQVLYLSLADIYYKNGVRFTPEMIATALGENPASLRNYLSLETSHDLRAYLDKQGLAWYIQRED